MEAVPMKSESEPNKKWGLLYWVKLGSWWDLYIPQDKEWKFKFTPTIVKTKSEEKVEDAFDDRCAWSWDRDACLRCRSCCSPLVQSVGRGRGVQVGNLCIQKLFSHVFFINSSSLLFSEEAGSSGLGGMQRNPELMQVKNIIWNGLELIVIAGDPEEHQGHSEHSCQDGGWGGGGGGAVYVRVSHMQSHTGEVVLALYAQHHRQGKHLLKPNFCFRLGKTWLIVTTLVPTVAPPWTGSDCE